MSSAFFSPPSRKVKQVAALCASQKTNKQTKPTLARLRLQDVVCRLVVAPMLRVPESGPGPGPWSRTPLLKGQSQTWGAFLTGSGLRLYVD